MSATNGVLANPYGFFSETNSAFVVTDVRTPRPWINVLSNDRFGVVISQAGGGFSWFDNCQLFRISRWEQDLVQDAMGRFVYVVDLEQPEEVWSTTYQPTRKPASFDQVEHRLGATTFTREFMGLRVKHTLFVPLDADAEVWIVEIENLTDKVRNLRLASYQELHLGGIGDWHREFHRLFMESRIVDNSLFAWKHSNLHEGRRDELETPTKVAFRWNAPERTRWITDKYQWLGRVGSTDRPDGLKDLPAESQTPRWDDPIAAGVIDLEIPSGQLQTLVHVSAAGKDESEVLKVLNRFSVEQAKSSLAETEENWRARCAKNPFPTSDPAENLMINAWLPYQSIAGRIYAKCAYYQQGGAYGYRDQLQDSLMYLTTEPQNTLLQLKRHAESMYEDGAVRHWWHPGTEIFQPSRHSDTCLWLAFGTLEYIDATGDLSALDLHLSFLPGGIVPTGFAQSPTIERWNKSGSGSLLDHCIRGIERSLALQSERGIPLLLAGDWNDGLSHAGLDAKGESFWDGMFLYHILTRLSPLLKSVGRAEEAVRYEREATRLRDAVNEYGWDGEWYMEGTRDDGGTLGGHLDEEGKIFLNPQTWSVISGIAPPDRAKIALASAKKHLVTDYGALLLQPAYSSVNPYVGYITRYAPGLRENGGVYSHASTWAIQAFAMAGDQETARKIFRGMLPPLRAQENVELYAAEPYVMPGNTDGPDSPYASRAGWTWYTGSAAWMVRIAKRWLTE